MGGGGKGGFEMIFEAISTVIFDVESCSTKCCIRRNGLLQKRHVSDSK